MSGDGDRIVVTLTDEQKADFDELVRVCGLPDRRTLLNEAMTLLEAAVQATLAGEGVYIGRPGYLRRVSTDALVAARTSRPRRDAAPRLVHDSPMRIVSDLSVSRPGPRIVPGDVNDDGRVGDDRVLDPDAPPA